MEILTSADLLECIDEVIAYLSNNEHVYYVALDVAQQLRDEVSQTAPMDNRDD